MFTEGQSDIVYAGDNSGGQGEVGWCFSCRVFSASQNLKENLCLFLQKIAASEMLSVCLLIAGIFAASGPNAVTSAVSLPLVQIECSFEVGHASLRGDVCRLFGSLVSVTQIFLIDGSVWHGNVFFHIFQITSLAHKFCNPPHYQSKLPTWTNMLNFNLIHCFL